MRAKSCVRLIAWLLTLLFTVHCSLTTCAAATTGAAFLQLGDTSRPLALGGAYTAMPGGVDSLPYNPGALAWQAHPEASFTHSEWLQDTSLDLVSYAHPTALGTLGLSALHMGAGTLEGRDINRRPTGSFTANDLAFLFSYSHAVGPYLGVGANAQYLRSRIDTESAADVAIDAGALGHVPGQPLWFGASARHIGSGLRFEDQVDRLPLTIAIGSAYQVRRPLIVTADFVHEPYDSSSEWRLGAEYSVAFFDFRAGYAQPLQGLGDTRWSVSEHLRGGLGLRWSRYRADYALAPFGDLGLTHRFTISLVFGEAGANSGPHNLQRASGASHAQNPVF